ncbi:translation initiation factor IF-2 [Paludicola sp. MB14-C6]|uniref:translation initiation factor IF-2 n=1 Tax=Paludihabitans sp. MB14-C6 TaxID=3070656 RepID=UPI0027DE86FF|nr:translation initiation factor IF-2 [Paludicola sp. MB14-C6]WMJ23010.1 translation initiation factor IF-2 [Paludicola sp. MB14-C6]
MKPKKIKIVDLAKDLNTQPNDIIEFLAKTDETPKKPTSSLTEDELNIVFDHYMAKAEVKSFDAYFSSADQKEQDTLKDNKPVENKPEVSKPEPKPNAQQPQQKPSQSQQKPAQPKENQFRPNNNRPDNRQGNRPDNRQNNRSENHSENRPAFRPNLNGQNNNNAKPGFTQNKPVHNQQKPVTPASQPAVTKERTIRHVDTKTVEVNLDKYNERYEEIAPQQASRKTDSFQRKQKINQKSQQRNKAKYSNKKETEAQKLQRMALERARKQQLKVMIPDEIVVSELASRLKVNVAEVIKKLMVLGVMASQTEVIDFDTASMVALELNAKVEREVVVTIEERLIDDSEDDSDNLETRNPIVVVMGHVDHGKTSLLDKIRNAHVTTTEAGGITQHIGAYTVKANDREITFLDTPGHEAFTSMRARGASVTDIAILVVAADDGIMPQTVEAINHAKAAGVQIIVAINKMDKPSANADKVKQELTEYELIPEEWGGETICCPVSALTGQGVDQLLEMVLLVADMADLKANPNRQAKGTVVEARLDKGRGPVATLLVQNGTLRTGDVLIAGACVGRVRVMTNDKGIVVNEAGPSYPVEVTGLAEVPSAGDVFNAVEDERLARTLVEQRKYEEKEEKFSQYQKVTLDNLFSQIAEGEMKELPIIVKADVQGSAEAVKQSLEKLSNDEVRVRVIHNGVGAIKESDVMLAQASNAIIIGFNVRPDPKIQDAMNDDEVEIRLYRIIYDAIDDVKQAMKGMLAPKTREVELGRAEVRQVYKISNVGTISGSYVLNGKVVRSALIRVVRDGIVIVEDKISSLKRFKDDAKEVAQGFECGIGLEKFNDLKEGDILESFIIEEYRD